jgi:AAA ATPase domain
VTAQRAPGAKAPSAEDQGLRRTALLIYVSKFASAPVEVADLREGDEGWDPLPFAPKRSEELAAALRQHGYDVSAVPEPDQDVMFDAVSDHLQDASAHCRIIHVISHGLPSDIHSEWLSIVPSGGQVDWLKTEVGSWIKGAAHRREPTLFLVDLCRSGRVALASWLQMLRPEAMRVGVIAAAWADEDAYDGRFSEIVTEVLHECRTNGLGTDATHPYVPLARLTQKIADRVLLRSGDRQHVAPSRMDGPRHPDAPFISNPNYFKDDPVLRARWAVDSSLRDFLDDPVADPTHYATRTGKYFAGRREELRALVPWLAGETAGDTGLHVVKGDPGTGKSALLGALVCAAHPVLSTVTPVRDTLDDNAPAIIRALAAVHARRRRLDELIASIASQLRLPASDEEWNVLRLVQAIASSAQTPVIVLDALDEAEDPDEVQTLLLLQLASARRPDGSPVCRLLVGVRPWEEFEPLFDTARAGGGLIDLNGITPQRLEAELEQFLKRVLNDAEAYRERGPTIGDRLAKRVARRLAIASQDSNWGAFLVARLYAEYLLRTQPPRDVDEAEQFAARVPRTLPEVLELDLADRDQAPTLRALLTALAYGHGEGLPAELIPDIAAQFEPNVLKVADPIKLLREQVGFYLRTATDQQRTVLYRLFHQGLSDHLRKHPTAPAEGGAS